MNQVKVSSKYQVVIPRNVRDRLTLKPGMVLTVIVYNNRLEFIPRVPVKSMRGFLKGMDTHIEREKDRV